MIAPILDEIADQVQRQDPIAKLNIDDNPATPPKFNIRGIPTLILFQNGTVEAPESRSSHQIAARGLSGQQPVRAYLGISRAAAARAAGSRAAAVKAAAGPIDPIAPRNDNRNGNTNGGRPPQEDYGDFAGGRR